MKKSKKKSDGENASPPKRRSSMEILSPSSRKEKNPPRKHHSFDTVLPKQGKKMTTTKKSSKKSRGERLSPPKRRGSKEMFSPSSRKERSREKIYDEEITIERLKPCNDSDKPKRRPSLFKKNNSNTDGPRRQVQRASSFDIFIRESPGEKKRRPQRSQSMDIASISARKSENPRSYLNNVRGRRDRANQSLAKESLFAALGDDDGGVPQTPISTRSEPVQKTRRGSLAGGLFRLATGLEEAEINELISPEPEAHMIKDNSPKGSLMSRGLKALEKAYVECS